MEELAIQTHDFEKAKNELKRFSERTTADLDLKKVDSDKGSNIAARNVTGKYVYENRKVLCV